MIKTIKTTKNQTLRTTLIYVNSARSLFSNWRYSMLRSNIHGRRSKKETAKISNKMWTKSKICAVTRNGVNGEKIYYLSPTRMDVLWSRVIVRRICCRKFRNCKSYITRRLEYLGNGNLYDVRLPSSSKFTYVNIDKSIGLNHALRLIIINVMFVIHTPPKPCVSPTT